VHDGRDDYDRFLKTRTIPEDEPVFRLRAQDAVAVDTVRHWAHLALAAGAPRAVVEQALRQADRMAAWPVKKVSDADHIADRRALEDAFIQRGWSAEATIADQARAAAHAAGRHEGFEAGVRSLQGPLERLQAENTTLRRELATAERTVQELTTRAQAAEDARQPEAVEHG
jgi:hypothetical protein